VNRLDDLGYPIIVAGDTRAAFRSEMSARFDRFVVLADRNVADLALRLTRLPARVDLLTVDLGERRKRLAIVEVILGALLGAGADRRTAIVGVGGGVAADVFGFAASIYMRGVPYAHVATSLVAMVDAAIGGKTGVNLEAGKNLAGSFADPVAVFCQVDALRTLPYRHLREGLAETVKHAVIEGGELFEALETLSPHPFPKWPWESVVVDSMRVKAMIVGDDRLESGSREVLNLGHTFGHAIERASDYRVSHGAGVSVGLRVAGVLAMLTGRFSKSEHLQVMTLLALLGLPARLRYPPGRVLEAMTYDKKSRHGRVRFVLPRAIGDVETGVHVSSSMVRRALQRCVTPVGDREFV